jgi:hypothetical protein
MTTGAWVLLAEMAKYDSVVYGDPKGRGPFCIVPGPGLRVDPDAVSPDLPKAEFCTELISAGLCEPLPRRAGVHFAGLGAFSTNGARYYPNTKRCYKVSNSWYENLKKGELE